MIRFIFDAVRYRCAYIDLDGCILRRFKCPHSLALQGIRGVGWLLWWRDNLPVRPVIKRRLPLLYLLRLLGVRLVAWTNRDQGLHHEITRQSLGFHNWLFAEFQYWDGTKILTRTKGPVMDDQPKFLACGKGRGLLVSQL